MVHPQYFLYPGYFETYDALQEGSWEEADAIEDVYIYTYEDLKCFRK